MNCPHAPFDGSYWVVPCKLLAGCYPGSADASGTQSKIEGLVRCGIRLIINLMEESEVEEKGNAVVPYEDIVDGLYAGSGVRIVWTRKPIKDLSIPPRAEMSEILDVIDWAIADGYAVYLHCWGGRGRTGTVIGCYFARHGIAFGSDALARVNQLRSYIR